MYKIVIPVVFAVVVILFIVFFASRNVNSTLVLDKETEEFVYNRNPGVYPEADDFEFRLNKTSISWFEGKLFNKVEDEFVTKRITENEFNQYLSKINDLKIKLQSDYGIYSCEGGISPILSIGEDFEIGFKTSDDCKTDVPTITDYDYMKFEDLLKELIKQKI